MGHVQRRLIAFDLDGTLVDSCRDLADSMNDLLAERGASPISEQTIARMIGDGARMLVRRALAHAGVEERSEDAERFLAIYDTRLLNHTRPYDGVLEAVRAARRHAHVAVLTNKALGPSERLLQGLGIRDLFDDVFGGDGPHPRKPDPSALKALMARAGSGPGRTLMIGDSRVDFETAVGAEARCCIAAYGFSSHTLHGVDTGSAWVAVSSTDVIGAIEAFVALPDA
jgi:phosphoglycolate phosphatase